MGMGMGVGLEDYDSPALVGVDGIQQPVSSSVSADSAEQTSGVDSPNFNPEATRLYSHAHAGTCVAYTAYMHMISIILLLRLLSVLVNNAIKLCCVHDKIFNAVSRRRQFEDG